jgi:hypothetical protein
LVDKFKKDLQQRYEPRNDKVLNAQKGYIKPRPDYSQWTSNPKLHQQKSFGTDTSF